MHPAPSQSSLWLISRVPCPSSLRDNCSKPPWRRMAPLRQWLSTYMPVYTYSFLGLVLLLLLLSCFSRVRLCATPWTAAHRAPPSPGFSRQEYSLTQLPPLLASLKVICSVKCRSHSFSEPLLLLLPYPTSPLFWTSFPFRRM